MQESVELLNCSNYLLKLGRVLALFPAQAGRGVGYEPMRREKHAGEVRGREGHVVASVVSSHHNFMHSHYAAANVCLEGFTQGSTLSIAVWG